MFISLTLFALLFSFFEGAAATPFPQRITRSHVGLRGSRRSHFRYYCFPIPGMLDIYVDGEVPAIVCGGVGQIVKRCNILLCELLLCGTRFSFSAFSLSVV